MFIILHLPYSEKKINDFKYLGKKKSTAKVLLRLVPKVCMLYYAYKLVVHMRLPSKNFHEQRDNTMKIACLEELVAVYQ